MKQIAEKLMECFKQANIEIDGYIDIDRLLYHPKILENVASLVADYVKEDKDNFSAIAVSDKIKGPYGILPAGVLVSVMLNRPLIVWKEFAVGFSRFFGVDAELEPSRPLFVKGVLILHDVLLRGNIIVKMDEALRSSGFELYKALVLIDKKQERIEEFKKLEKQSKITVLIPPKKGK